MIYVHNRYTRIITSKISPNFKLVGKFSNFYFSRWKTLAAAVSRRANVGQSGREEAGRCKRRPILCKVCRIKLKRECCTCCYECKGAGYKRRVRERIIWRKLSREEPNARRWQSARRKPSRCAKKEAIIFWEWPKFAIGRILSESFFPEYLSGLNFESDASALELIDAKGSPLHSCSLSRLFCTRRANCQ